MPMMCQQIWTALQVYNSRPTQAPKQYLLGLGNLVGRLVLALVLAGKFVLRRGGCRRRRIRQFGQLRHVGGLLPVLPAVIRPARP